MAEILVIVGVALLWSFLYGELSAFNLLAGAVLAMLLLVLVQRGNSRTLPARLWHFVLFVLVFARELLKAGVFIGRLALAPRPRFHPHIIAVPLKVESDAAISLLSAAITLLPGTVAMGTSADRRTLYAHAIALADPDDARKSVTDIESLILGFMH